MKVVVTGANGFVGRALCNDALARGYHVVAATRHSFPLSSFMDCRNIGSINAETDWQHVLFDCNVLVHCAAHVHVSHNSEFNELREFRRVNVEGTLNLARQAVENGVERFVFISSIGVNGSETFLQPFIADTEVRPYSPYAISKYEAEIGLKALAAETGIDLVIIRPPLVYGSGAPGNFGSLVNWIRRGLPLPLGAIYNQRSLISIDNLVDLIVTCISHPAAANQTFLVSDGVDVSTSELIRRMGHAMGYPARLIPLPVFWLKLTAALIGKSEMVHRLCGSLQVHIDKTRYL
jgi:UDP-glucose 4-epimerase